MSNFTSPPCHAMSFFFFPVYPSAIRGVDELALRVLPPYLLYHPHSSLRSPLSIPTTLSVSFSFSLFVSSPFSSISRPSFRLSHRPSPSFFLSLGRFIASSTTLRSPPSTPLPTFSLFRRARWFHLLIPSSPTPKTLFSRGPFASTVIRHPSFSFSLPLFFLLTPTDRERQPPLFPRFFPISLSLALSLPLSLFLLL